MVDFGCGEGVLLERLAEAGASALGIDLVQEMVDASRARLHSAGIPGEVRLGGVDALADIEDASVDAVLALNVLAYFDDVEVTRFYAEAARIIRPGGALVVTHSNELFDLTSFNRYTVEFHARYLSGPEHTPEISSFLTNADEPERTTFKMCAPTRSATTTSLRHMASTRTSKSS